MPTREERFDAELDNEELLEGIPDVKPPHRLRIRQQNTAIALAFDMQEMLDRYADPDFETITTEELRELASNRRIKLPADASHDQLIELLTPTDYAAQNKDDLLALARERKLEVTAKSSKEDVVAALEDSDPDEPFQRAQLMEMLDFAARIDEWAEETIAGDVHEEYVAWAEGKPHQTFFALLTKYASALGK